MSWVTAAEGAPEYRAIYESKVRPAVAQLEMMRIVTFVVAIVGFLVVLQIFIQIGAGLARMAPVLAPAVPFFFLAGLLIAGGGAAFLLWRLHQDAHARLMKAIAGAYGFTYEPGGTIGDLSNFTVNGLAPGSVQRVVHGVIRGPSASGTPFEIADVSDSQGIGNSRFTTFHGFLGRTAWPKAFPCTVVIKREGLGGPPNGLERVGLVDSDFERRFAAYSNDQVLSRVLLDPTEIESWVKLDNEIGGRLQAAFQGNQILFSMVTVNLPSGDDSWPAAYKSYNKPQWVEPLARDLYAASRLAGVLRPTEAWLR